MTTDRPRVATYDPALRSRGLFASACWAIACLVVFVWWASHYRSLVEFLAEWQFYLFDRYFPSLTVVFAVALLGVPVALLVALFRRRRRRRAERADILTPRDRVEIAINSALRGRMFFGAGAVAALVCAFGALLALLALPPTSGRVLTVTGRDNLREIEGPARFAPGRTFGRVARLEENVGLARRVTYVVPVRPVGVHSGPVRYFTEVERLAGPTWRFAPIPDGIMVADGLPRELVHLYGFVDVRTVDQPYLLVRDAWRLRWRPIVLAVQLVLVSLLAFLAAALLGRQARRLERALAREDRANADRATAPAEQP